jgi:hypothetical protein
MILKLPSKYLNRNQLTVPVHPLLTAGWYYRLKLVGVQRVC